MDTALLIIALLLVLTALAPVAPATTRQQCRRAGLRTRVARQLRLWDRYLAALYDRGREQGW